MTIRDTGTLIKKIVVGIIIAFIPFLIFFIGLRLVHHIF